MEITPEVVEAFCTDFEGFADSSRWPTAQLVRALQTADRETGSNRWGGYSDHSIKQRGMVFFAAHHLTMSKAGARATTTGGARSSGAVGVLSPAVRSSRAARAFSPPAT